MQFVCKHKSAALRDKNHSQLEEMWSGLGDLRSSLVMIPSGMPCDRADVS